MQKFKCQHYVLRFNVPMSNFELVHDRQVPKKKLRAEVLANYCFAGLHRKLNALFEHEEVKAKVGLDLRPYFGGRGYFEEEPLLDSPVPRLPAPDLNALDRNFVTVELSTVNVSMDSSLTMSDVLVVGL